jgi:hypothetical protein
LLRWVETIIRLGRIGSARSYGVSLMIKSFAMPRLAVVALSLAALSACAPQSQPPIPDAPRRAEMGGPLPGAGTGVVLTDPAGNTTARERLGAPLAPGGTGPVVTGGPNNVTERERLGAPLSPTGAGTLGTSGSSSVR